MEPDLWRGAERNRTGDRFTFEVKRAVIREVSFQGSANERFTLRLALCKIRNAQTILLSLSGGVPHGSDSF